MIPFLLFRDSESSLTDDDTQFTLVIERLRDSGMRVDWRPGDYVRGSSLRKIDCDAVSYRSASSKLNPPGKSGCACLSLESYPEFWNSQLYLSRNTVQMQVTHAAYSL